MPTAKAAASKPKVEPSSAQAPVAPKPLDMLGAMTLARETVAGITGLAVDSVSRCAPSDGKWRVRVEVIESRARLGDNDFLAVYDLLIGSDGGLEGFERVGRYNRTDGAAQIAA